MMTIHDKCICHSVVPWLNFYHAVCDVYFVHLRVHMSTSAQCCLYVIVK